jgi:hypothetical protein
VQPERGQAPPQVASVPVGGQHSCLDAAWLAAAAVVDSWLLLLLLLLLLLQERLQWCQQTAGCARDGRRRAEGCCCL